MKIKDIIKKGYEIDRLDLELLLASVLDKSREFLISNDDFELSETEFNELEGMIFEREKGRPVEQLIGYKEFFGLKFFVDDRCLIPRPETEFLVQKVIDYVGDDLFTIVDIGTGSGNIAISLAKNLPKCEVWGIEISEAALDVAKINRAFHKVNLELVKGNLLRGISKRFDIIVANLPYIGTDTNSCVSKETTDYEPSVALFGGKDGLGLYRELFQYIKDKDYKPQLILGEIGFSQGEGIKDVLLSILKGYTVTVIPDYAGLDRYFIAEKC